MDLTTLHRRSIETWTDRLARVRPDQWDAPTPCTEWSVRDLVNHVVGEDRWTVPLMHGSTISDVGASLDGDLLGASPLAAGTEAAGAALAVVEDELPAHRMVHLSYGDESMDEYVRQLCADHLIHAWDLAAATGGDTRLDPELVAEVGAWFAEREELFRAGGVVGPRPPAGPDPQEQLLAAFGRTGTWVP
ncbi:MAG: TIGR03086 family metal-binding protein [Nocardioides sp.]